MHSRDNTDYRAPAWLPGGQAALDEGLLGKAVFHIAAYRFLDETG